MDRVVLGGSYRPELIDWLADGVDDASQSLLSDWHLNRGTSILNLLATSEAISTIHCDSSNHVFSQVLCYLQNQPVLEAFHLQCVQNGWQCSIELHIHDGTNHL